MSPFDTDLASLVTESDDPGYALLDSRSVGEIAQIMNDADARVPGAVRQALPSIVPAIEAASALMEQGGRLIYAGAGTAGRMGVIDAAECRPTFNIWPGQVEAVIAGGSAAVVSSVEGAEDDVAAGAAAMDHLEVGALDTVVGIASSGRTPFVLGAVTRARERGALVVGLSCNTGTKLSGMVDHAIEIELGPEVVAGSTRLKAGTAQKLVLNMFSTITMIRLGKTYGSLMVDVRATNHKLHERAIRIVTLIAKVPRDQAAAVLESVGMDVKLASLMLARGEDSATAQARLDRVGGRLRLALEEA